LRRTAELVSANIGTHELDHYGIHKDRVASTFCHVTLSADKPKDCAFPTKLNYVGDHLRKRRLDLRLLQREVAKQIGVTTCTVQYWEANRVAPAIRFRPQIDRFLGYDCRVGAATESLAQRLKNHRQKHGLSQKRLAALLGIDQSSVAGWEFGRTSSDKQIA
jgi:transcriptional regulator with XRE-family HTH domain